MDVFVGHWVEASYSEGPGLRAAVWVQGCSIRCPGCCNPELFDPQGGERVPVESLARRILAARRLGIEGVTWLGGEPFDQAAAVAAVSRVLRREGLGVVTFTGYALEALRAGARPGARELLAATDTLVDGPFVAARRTHVRPWVGSSNQRVWHLTPRYRAAWAARGAQGVTVRIGADVIEVSGWAPTVRRLERRSRHGDAPAPSPAPADTARTAGETPSQSDEPPDVAEAVATPRREARALP